MSRELFDATPPWSLEAEVSVLGALLIDTGAITRVLPILRRSDFYRESHRELYDVMVHLYEGGKAIDPVTVSEELKRRGALAKAGGYEYLSGLLDAVPSARNVGDHARIVSRKAVLRRVIEEAEGLVKDAYRAEDAGGAVAARIDKLGETVGLAGASDFRPIKDALWPAFERIEEMQKQGGMVGVKSGFKDVDRMLCGFQPGNLVIVAARPSMGKTSWVMNALENAALAGIPSAIVSLEMTSKELTVRALASMARIDMQKLRRGELSPEEHQRLAAAAGHLNTMPLWIDDHPVTRAGDLRAKLTRLVRREGIKICAIDYLQLMEGSGEENRRLEIGAITRALKHAAQDLQIPIIVLSQLSRAPDARSNHRPMLSDLRESGDIEQDADVVLFLYRPEMYLMDMDEGAKGSKKVSELRDKMAGKAELICAKQRNGPTGTVTLYFHKAFTRFEDYTSRNAPTSEEYWS